MGDAIEELGFARWPPPSSSASSSTTATTSTTTATDPMTPMQTNHDSTGSRQLSHAIQKMSIDTPAATPLPASPQVTVAAAERTAKLQDAATGASSPHTSGLKSHNSHTTTRRSSITKNGGRRSSTPTLNKKSSVSSLQGAGVGGVTSPRPLVSRSSTHNLPSSHSSNSMPPRSPLTGMNPQPVGVTPPTAAMVASTCLQAELELHRDTSSSSKAVVVLQDSCYGHRYSRPKTSRASLSTIVERPERIHASVLGIATAYVRLGGRHVGGRHPPRPKQDPSLLGKIPFRIHKTARSIPLASPVVTFVHGTKWMDELTVMCEAAEAKLALNGKELVRPVESRGASPTNGEAKPRLHEGDLYLCRESLEALEGCIGAVCEGVDQVFQHAPALTSRAFVCIRPPGHHCSSSYPSGFCWLNNVHIGIAHAAINHGLTHAAIIDFDLHHGDGSQSIAWAHNSRISRLPKNAANSKKSSIGYFSLHDINSYPCELGDEDKVRNASLCLENAHGQTVWNVHLQPWKSEAEFWELYEEKYSILIEKARIFLRTHTQRLQSANSANSPVPKAAIFLSAGFDASEWESEGMQRHKVNVPTDFYARLTKDVVKLAEEEGLGVDGRIISVLEGGYSDRALSSGVLSHLSGLAGADDGESSLKTTNAAGLGYEMGKRIGVVDDLANKTASLSLCSVDAQWWSPANLEELEVLVNPPPTPAPKPSKVRNATPPTYSSPTQSFTAKINTSSPIPYRSASSGSFGGRSRAPSLTQPARPVTPPPPKVGWAVAAHELSKLLIPADRETRSCKAEDLAVEATRARKQAQQAQASLEASDLQLASGGKRMTLRDRKARTPNPPSDLKTAAVTVPASRINRRKTVAGPDVITEGAVGDEGPTLALPSAAQLQRQRRRSSAVSSVGSMDMAVASTTSTVTPTHQPTRAGSRPGSAMGTSIAAARRPSSTATSTGGATGGLTVKKVTKPRVPTQPRPASKKKTTQPPLQPKPAAPIVSPGVQQTIVPAPMMSTFQAQPQRRPSYFGPQSAHDLEVKPDYANSDTIAYPSLPSSSLESHTSRPGQTGATDSGLDALTSGFKGIKLNVPSREEYEARQREREKQQKEMADNGGMEIDLDIKVKPEIKQEDTVMREESKRPTEAAIKAAVPHSHPQQPSAPVGLAGDQAAGEESQRPPPADRHDSSSHAHPSYFSTANANAD